MMVTTAVTTTAAIAEQVPESFLEKKRSQSRQFSSQLRASVSSLDGRWPINTQRKERPWHRDLLSSSTRASSILAPVAVASGTAYVYAAVIQHPSSTLTPLSVMYMLLLAFQYAVQPRLARRFIPPQNSSAHVALAEESVKTVLAVGIVGSKLFTTCRSTGGCFSAVFQHPILFTWTWQSSLAMAGVPAILYALQGVLQYRAYQTLDTVTYNGLSQGKTMTAALACWLLLGKRQSPLQILSLVLLLGSTLLFQRNSSSSTSKTKGNAKPNNAPVLSNRFLSGVLPCLAATALSGVAGALSQKGLQTTGGGSMHRDPYVFTVEVSLYSAMVLGLSRLWCAKRRTMQQQQQHPSRHRPTAAQPPATVPPRWTWHTWIPIVSKACGGILTALVHQTAGTVQKGFALVLGLVFARLWQQWHEGRVGHQQTDDWNSTFATLLVLISSWLHFTNPS